MAANMNAKKNNMAEAPEPAAATKAEPELEECFFCFEDLPKDSLRTTECGHHLCRNCILAYLREALDSQVFVPIRCCQAEIPRDWAKQILAPRTWTLYRDRCEEHDERQKGEFYYCGRAVCSKYIPRRHRRRNVLLCSCKSRTCRNCNLIEHTGQTCEETFEAFAAESARTAERIAAGDTGGLDNEEIERMGCKYCPYCLAIIHRYQGCPQMVCNCGANFNWDRATAYKANQPPPKRRARPNFGGIARPYEA